MTLKEAKNKTKAFTYAGDKITPQLADDWTFKVYTNYTNGDRIVVHSEKLNIRFIPNMDLEYFFNNYVFNGIISIDKNKFIGNMAFNKYTPIMEKEFLEAQEIVSENELVENIPNNELIEGAIYTDDLGDNYVYMGNMAYTIVSQEHTYKKPKKRYIYKYNDYVDYSKLPIIKTKKFKTLKKIMSLEEKNKFVKTIFNRAFSFGHIFIRTNGNTLIELVEDVSYLSSKTLIKFGDRYGFYQSQNYWENKPSEFIEIDIEAYKEDILNQKVDNLINIDNYKIQEIDDFDNFETDKERQQVRFYLDYE